METLKKINLFWDTDLNSLDPKANRQFIISRILNLGDVEDFRWAMDFYGSEAIKKQVKESRNLDEKSLFFWRQYFNLSEEECSPKQLTAQHSAFWQR